MKNKKTKPFQTHHEGSPYSHPIRIGRIFAYLSNPRKSRAMEKVVGLAYPSADFINVENPVSIVALSEKKEDRIPSVLFVDDRTAGCLNIETLKKKYPHLSVIFASENQRICTTPRILLLDEYPHLQQIDIVAAAATFTENEFQETINAFIRLAEDAIRIRHPLENQKRFVVLIVDDEPHWIAQFLPTLYGIIGRRADVVVRETYEDSMDFISKMGARIVCLIADMFFPKNGEITDDAGRELINRFHALCPNTAKIISSKASAGEEFAGVAHIFHKTDSDGIVHLRRFIRDYAGFGDFMIRTNGDIKRIRTIPDLRHSIEKAPVETVAELVERKSFSTWLYLHGFVRVGKIADGIEDMYKAAKKSGFQLRNVKKSEEEIKRIMIQLLDNEDRVLKREPFVIFDDQGQIKLSTFSLRIIRDTIYDMPAELLQKWEDEDRLSDWLTRHGYIRLADELRPIRGTGDDVRLQVIEIFDKWITWYEARKIVIE